MQEVLEEIEEERQQAFPRERLVEEDDDDSGIVLVACKDERSCMQLEDFITNGRHKVFLISLSKFVSLGLHCIY